MDGSDPLMNAEIVRAKHVQTHPKFDLHDCPYDSCHGECRNAKENCRKVPSGREAIIKCDTRSGEAKPRREGT